MIEKTYEALRARHQKEFADFLQQVDLQNPKTFQDIMDGAEKYGPGHAAVMRQTSAPEYVLQRWIRGLNAPLPGIRIGLATWMRETILSSIPPRLFPH